MKLHPHVIEHLIFLFENYGGHVNNSKLKDKLNAIDLSAYERKTGTQDIVLVLTDKLMSELGKK